MTEESFQQARKPIAANELRIGNLLLGTLTKKHVIVDWLVLKHIQDDGNIQSCHLPDGGGPVYEPIPLTEEWLKRCGFVKCNWGAFDLEKLTVALPGFPGFPKGRVWFNSWAILEHSLQFVHELQNIWRALTGQELEIKEKV